MSVACGLVDDDDRDGTGGATGARTGGSSNEGGTVGVGGDATSGGAISSGGTTATGGSSASGGTSAGGTSTSGGSASGGETASGGFGSGASELCPAGVVTTLAAPHVYAWQMFNGFNYSGVAPGDAAGPVSFTTQSADTAYIFASLSAWSGDERDCLDVTDFSGVEFDLGGTFTTEARFEIVLSSEHASAHCSASALEMGTCNANPWVVTSAGTNVRVSFVSMNPSDTEDPIVFDPQLVIGLVWKTTGEDYGKTMIVSNVSFY